MTMNINNMKVVAVSLNDKELLNKIGKLVGQNKAKVLNFSDDKMNYLVDKKTELC